MANPTVQLNGNQVQFESTNQPYIHQDGYTLIPLRAIGDMLQIDITWSSPNIHASSVNQSTGENLAVVFDTNNNTLNINGATKQLSTPVVIKDGTTYIPLRVFSETFGYDVAFESGIIEIDTPNKKVDTPTPVDTPTEIVVETTQQGHEFTIDEPTKVQIQIVNGVPVITPVGESSTTVDVTPTVTVSDEEQLEQFRIEVLELVNQYRAEAGVAPLSTDSTITKLAQIKCDDMADNDYFSHTSPTWGDFQNVFKYENVSYRYIGENIAYGQRTPEAVMDSWMNSDGHRANILSENFSHIGIGYNTDGNYWTQLFVTYR